MSEYKKPYLILFNAISQAVEQIDSEQIGEAKEILMVARLKAEDAFINFEDDEENI